MTIAESTMSPAAGEGPPHSRHDPLVIRPRSGWIGVNFHELWRFRDLLFSLFERDLKLRYKQTVLGVVWVVLQPLIGALIFAKVFGGMAGMKADPGASGQPIPYFLYAFTGLVAWNLFASILSKLYSVLVGNASLVSKVYFPRLLLPVGGALGALVDMAVALVLMVVLQAAAGIGVGLQVLLAPAMLALIFIMALGIGMWAAALCVEYRDVGYVLPVVLPFLMICSPVVYAASKMSSGRHGYLYFFNPLAGLLTAWKWSVLSTPFPPMWAFVYGVAGAVGVLLVGVVMFRRMERTFADVI